MGGTKKCPSADVVESSLMFGVPGQGWNKGLAFWSDKVDDDGLETFSVIGASPIHPFLELMKLNILTRWNICQLTKSAHDLISSGDASMSRIIIPGIALVRDSNAACSLASL